MDPVDKTRPLAEKRKIAFPLLSDTDHRAIDAYGLYNASQKIAFPAVFIIDTKGRVRWAFFDEDYKIRPLNDALLAELKKIK